MDRESSAWKKFTKKDGHIATCNTCHKDYSYKGSVSNLTKHWRKKHARHLSMSSDVSDRNSDDSDEEQAKAVEQITEKKPVATWRYFTATDPDKCEAICKICNESVSYETVSDLTQHLQDHGEEPKHADEDYVAEVQEKTEGLPKRRFKSPVWNFFRRIDEKMAVCLLCKNFLNFASSISNLRKHLKRKHGDVNISQNSFAKRIYLNGELYEVASEQEQEDNYEDIQILDTDPIYLSNDAMDKPPTPSPKKKQPKLAHKRNFSKISEEQVHSTRNTYSEEQLPLRREVPSYTPSPMGSIDYFGQYVVSLLKELPKAVSDQLQSEIIKQILTSKMALHPTTVAPNYEIKISHNSKKETSVPDPVCYTVVQTSEGTEKTNMVTGNVVQE